MPNHLDHEYSPYLLQHAHNPVDWYPWGPEALDKARQDDKPIFLSIGYAACHWCHVMAHESFENPDLAVILNQNFICIKVDREERPDLDGIYMTAVTAMTGSGGWPLSVFLTPAGQPFFGGTYFPPVPRYNMPAFRDVLLSIARAWKEERLQVLATGKTLVDHIQTQMQVGVPAGTRIQSQDLAPLLDTAALALAQSYDWQNGGWGRAPKFPQPMAIEFLLRKATRGDSFARDTAVHALKAMAQGGMYDVVGGGFARYSTDDHWLVPHFEKMLYDNAQLALAYLHGYLITHEMHFRRVCEETLDFVARELSHPLGGFFSSLDADSEGEEGKFYLWTEPEIMEVGLESSDKLFLRTAYGITEAGNFDGKTILQRALDDRQLAEKFDLPIFEVAPRLQYLHTRLLAARSRRVRPATDDKVLTSWNALMLTAFAEAARYLRQTPSGETASSTSLLEAPTSLADRYLALAIRNADFILTCLHPADRLLRSWKDGVARHNAYLEDYAALILSLLALYQSDPNPRWFSAAASLGEEMVAHFQDPDTRGFFDTRDDHETLLTRPKDLQDNATPSGSALAAMALLQLSAYTSRGDWRDLASETLAALQPTAVRYPNAFSYWLSAMDFALGPVQEVAILGLGVDPQTLALTSSLWSAYRPRLVAALASFPPPAGAPPLLLDRPLLHSQPTAYICYNFTCQQPVNSAEEFSQQLKQS